MKPWQKGNYVPPEEEKVEEVKEEIQEEILEVPEKRYVCEICGASFSYPHQLRNHTLGHLRQEERKAEEKLKTIREQLRTLG